MKVICQYLTLLFLSSLMALFNGCAYFNINNQIEQAKNSTIISGTILYSGELDGPIIVLAYNRRGDAVRTAHYVVLEKPGSYELLVPRGDYYISAFIDRNRNLRFDFDEFAGVYGQPDQLAVRDSGILTDINVTIPTNRQNRIDFPIGQSVQDSRPSPFHSSVAGTLFDLSDPNYSLKTAEHGYWRPVDFFREFGGNIYFLEPYDPKKIPVLFVHGAMGSPANFQTLSKTLDHSKYQFWFFYYPSGSGLTSMANLLSKKIDDLYQIYNFKQLHIVAHSMGGLVSRAFLVSFGSQHPYIRSFISLCTPWGGVETAEKGVASSPFILSSWRDIAKNSLFIENIYSKQLPHDLPFYLFFGFRGDRVPWKDYNDGSVTIQSQLDPRAQAEARGTFGFDNTHTGILDDPNVIEQVQAVLDRNSESLGKSQYAQLSLLFSGMENQNPPSPFMARMSHENPLNNPLNRNLSFILNPLKTEAQELILPPDNYFLDIFAWGYRAHINKTELELKTATTQEVFITLKPITLLEIVFAGKSDVDRPNLGLLPTNNGYPQLDSIQLIGQSITRKLLPTRTQLADLISQYLKYQDFYAEGKLVFFDLVPGNYKLEGITTKGEKFSLDCAVMPGKSNNTYTITL